MGNNSLRKRVIRLAFENPELRKDLLPLVRSGGFGGAGSFRRRASEEVAVGDFFVSSWGYDQTNVDFYQVTGTTRTMVKLRALKKKIVGGKGGPYEKVMPIANTMYGPEIRKKLKEWSGRPYIKLNSRINAYKWDGRPETQTGGAFGH